MRPLSVFTHAFARMSGCIFAAVFVAASIGLGTTLAYETWWYIFGDGPPLSGWQWLAWSIILLAFTLRRRPQ